MEKKSFLLSLISAPRLSATQARVSSKERSTRMSTVQSPSQKRSRKVTRTQTLDSRDFSTVFPGCPCTDDLAVLKSDNPPPSSFLSAQDGPHPNLHTRPGTEVRIVVDAVHSWYQVR